jgi:hypothetical protein
VARGLRSVPGRPTAWQCEMKWRELGILAGVDLIPDAVAHNGDLAEEKLQREAGERFAYGTGRKLVELMSCDRFGFRLDAPRLLCEGSHVCNFCCGVTRTSPSYLLRSNRSAFGRNERLARYCSVRCSRKSFRRRIHRWLKLQSSRSRSTRDGNAVAGQLSEGLQGHPPERRRAAS